MGKNNTTKKGKQKVPAPVVPISAAPPLSPPPLAQAGLPLTQAGLPLAVSSPPTAYHIQHPSGTIDTIEEQEERGGHLSGPAEGPGEESWQDVAADGWGADIPENSNGDFADNGLETGGALVSMPPLPPQPPPKLGGGRDRAKPHYPQLPPSSIPMGFGANAGARRAPESAGYANANAQPLQDTWTSGNDGWGGDGWEDQEDEPDEDEGWGPGENDGWNDTGSGWGQQHHSATWNHAVSAQSVAQSAPPLSATSRGTTGGWQSWGEEARRLPKVTFDLAVPPSPSSTGSKTILSQLQRSQILSALLNNPQQTQRPYPMPPNSAPSMPAAANSWQQPRPQPPLQHVGRNQHQQHGRHQSFYRHPGYESKKNRKSRPQMQDLGVQPQQHPPRQEQSQDAWGLGDGWSDLHDEEEQPDRTQDAWGRKVHFSPGIRASMLPSSAPSVVPSAVVENITVNALPQNKLGISTTIPMSKTLSYAYSGSTPSTESEPGRAAMHRITDFQFIESRGDALKTVQRAFYGKQRKASDRFHWLFPPDKDERVSSLLSWINSVSFGIASFGLQKFLQTRERGAFVVNAAYRPVHSPSEPAFDWVTWNQIQLTMDRVLQESVGYYNPAMHIIVFVFLPSPSGNSVAIWRRKLPIPNNIRLAYQAQITQAMASLQKEYPVLVDELPTPPELTPPPPPPKKKRKWYKLWLSS